MLDLKSIIRDVPDFPKQGILFKDITPILSNPDAFEVVVDALAGLTRAVGATHVVGIESRGFILGTPVAVGLGLPFVPVRKPGKLPADTERVEYELEYGTDALEIHKDSLGEGARVVIIDDLLATGGTANAACEVVESLGAKVAGVLVMIELSFLNGVERLKPHDVHSLIRY
ncbi:MAG: adenine phosphoribosyltransferase [Myxococcota bacterium]|nr:adenine phosphoribosyltransferase [Myxococcota bacterium]